MFRSSIFYGTLKTRRLDPRFQSIHRSFKNCESIKVPRYHECDLAIIQGWFKENSNAPHNSLRKKIIEHQFKNNKHVLTIDGNIFHYMSQGKYFRYSINGIFANTGYYFDHKIDPQRWETISKDIGCKLVPWRHAGNHILLLAQKNSGWTMQEKSSLDWAIGVISEVKKYSDRKIVIRVHPTDISQKSKYQEISKLYTNVEVSDKINIRDDLSDAWCSITHNSSPGAVSIIEGIPTFITDPMWERSPAAPVGNINIADIETPFMPDRQEWVERIAMSHFSIDDISSGLLWHRTLQYFDRMEK